VDSERTDARIGGHGRAWRLRVGYPNLRTAGLGCLLMSFMFRPDAQIKTKWIQPLPPKTRKSCSPAKRTSNHSGGFAEVLRETHARSMVMKHDAEVIQLGGSRAIPKEHSRKAGKRHRTIFDVWCGDPN
jgi:hypothetical protein